MLICSVSWTWSCSVTVSQVLKVGVLRFSGAKIPGFLLSVCSEGRLARYGTPRNVFVAVNERISELNRTCLASIYPPGCILSR